MTHLLEKLLQDSNQNLQFIQSEVTKNPNHILTWKEAESKWSVFDVVDHLNKVYELYLPNFKKAIENAPELANKGYEEGVQRTIIGRLSIYAMKPKGSRRRFKMKTFDFFMPSYSDDSGSALVDTFIENKNMFNGFIKDARFKNLKGIKIPTALGEKMKFYIPECFEFILAHENRHLVQIKTILNKRSNGHHS